MSIIVIAGSKQKIARTLLEIVREQRSVVIACNEQDLPIPRDCKVVIIENIFNLPSVLSRIDNIDVVVVSVYDVIRGIKSNYSHQLARRIIEKIFIWLYAFSKARGVKVYIMSPLSITNKKPLIQTPGHVVISKVKLL